MPNSKRYHLYILKCADGSLYTGITTDVDRRVEEHNHSKLGARYTRSRRPVVLAYSKAYRGRSLASREEAKVKGLSRMKKLGMVEEYERKSKHRH